MNELKKGDTVDHMTEEERKAFRLSIDPDAMGTDEDKYEGMSHDSN